MNWIKINFCDEYNSDTTHGCLSMVHFVNLSAPVCDYDSLPSEVGEYLVSDGTQVGIGKWHIGFGNHNYEHKIKNKDIKYWMSLDNVKPPDGI